MNNDNIRVPGLFCAALFPYQSEYECCKICVRFFERLDTFNLELITLIDKERK
jgi:hypothetical protein